MNSQDAKPGWSEGEIMEINDLEQELNEALETIKEVFTQISQLIYDKVQELTDET